MFDLIDDDEWFELGLTLSNTLAQLPVDSIVVEALQVPPFRLALSAIGEDETPRIDRSGTKNTPPTSNHAVVTRPCLIGLDNQHQAVGAAIDLANSETRTCPTALSIAITQTSDGEHFAIAIVGIPGEAKSWTTFGLGPGGHSIDVGYLVLEQLERWNIFRGGKPSVGQSRLEVTA